MSLHRVLSRKKASAAAKKSSKAVTLAAACLVLAVTAMTMKMAYDFAWVVTEIQHTIAPVDNMPSEAEGVFYFVVDPGKTTTL